MAGRGARIPRCQFDSGWPDQPFFSGEKSCSWELGVCKTPVEQVRKTSVGSSPFLSAKLLKDQCCCNLLRLYL